MHTDDFDFQLPHELIAQHPLARRDASRLLHVRRPSGRLEHHTFSELPGLLRKGDLLVFNDSRVIPARLLGKKKGTGGKAELLLVRPASDVQTASALEQGAGGTTWVCLGQSSKGFRPGMELEFDAGLTAEILESIGNGEYRVRFTSPLSTLEEALARAGKLPLPPYIERSTEAADDERYQTVYARAKGSVAAPTAGLHFTPELLADLKARGVETCFVTLEVGPGTFLPVREGPVSEHRMHEERAVIPAAAADAITRARAEGRRVVAVGTTVVRTLEGSPLALSTTGDTRFSTSIFITPGFKFRLVDALITNFHLPKSTLVMLVSAFLGREQTLAAYRAAIDAKYRFFSYGDSMFIEDDPS
ncbi:MAG: tRNA preQ1(34) S-adenosylmethionine ribosyltransferase-isomerase QueA [Myxococcaceae bacterium]